MPLLDTAYACFGSVLLVYTISTVLPGTTAPDGVVALSCLLHKIDADQSAALHTLGRCVR